MRLQSRAAVFIGLLLAGIVAFSLKAVADQPYPGPIEMLQQATDGLLSALESNREAIDADAKAVLPIIETQLIPHVDFEYMARWVVGRSAWKKASDAEREDFVQAFRDLLVRTYANVATEYKDETITYYPIRGDIEGKKRVQVSSAITQSGREPIEVVYRLNQAKSGEWKLYDIVIEGVSLLKGFQSQFEEKIRQEGLAALTDEINNHNLDEQVVPIPGRKDG